MMKRSQLQSVTTLQRSPTDERRVRFIKYTVAMTIRVVCIVLMVFVEGWWLLVCAAGAVFLPYFAVIIANAVRIERVPEVVRPGPLMLSSGFADSGQADSTSSDQAHPVSEERR
jgi:predicted tellurium resistance membrane protein TerC